MIARRSFLGAILAAGVAPAFVRAGVLMPVKEIWVPGPPSVSVTFWNGAWHIDGVATTMPKTEYELRGSELQLYYMTNRSTTFTLPSHGSRIKLGKPQVMHA